MTNGNEFKACRLDPFFWHSPMASAGAKYMVEFMVDKLAEIDHEKLSRVSKCVAYIEEVRR